MLRWTLRSILSVCGIVLICVTAADSASAQGLTSSFTKSSSQPAPTEANYLPQDRSLEPVDVFVHSGEFVHKETDFRLPSRGFDFVLSRQYRSGITYQGPMGHKWDFIYGMRLFEIDNPGQGDDDDVQFYNGTGRMDTFEWNGSGYDAPTGLFYHLEKDTSPTPDEYILTTPQKMRFVFQQYDSGQWYILTEIQDRNYDQGTRDYNRLTVTYVSSSDKIDYILDTLGRTIDFAYDGSNYLTQVSYNSAAVATYLYDTNHDLTKVAKPGSSTTKYEYTGTHQLEKITDPVQVAATGDAYIYNIYDSTAATGAVTKQYFGAEAGQGASGSASYNAMAYTSGRLDSTNRLNDEVDYILDGSDRIASKILGGFTTSYTYDSQGMVSTVTMPLGNLMSYTYDATTHTQKGNLLHAVHFDQVAGTGLSTSYTYTTLNLIDTITDPVDRYTDHDYDAQGNRVTTSYYDASTSGTLVGQEVFAYDTTNEGVLTKYTDANGNDTQYNYSTINSENAYRSAEIVLMAAGASDDITTSYAYDAYGNVTAKTDPLSHTTTMSYDAAQRLTQRASCSCGPKMKYHYDENSNLVSKETLYDTDGGESYLTTIHQYDDFALLTKVIQEDYDGSNDLSTVYTYDVADRRASVTDPLGNETTYTYDGRGLEITREIEGNSGTSADDIVLLSAYDSNGNLTKSTDGRSLTTDYQYDKYDRRTKTLDHDDHYSTTSYDASGMAITSSSYNSSDTLLAQTVSAYDARGRRTKSSVYAKTAGGSAIPTSGNFLETTYVYDDQGNLTSVEGPGGEETAYIYDKANRKVTMQEDLTSSTTVDTEYSYDKASRVTKTIYEENLSSARRVDVEYDDADRPTKRKYYAGTSTHSYSELMAYDVRNNVTLRQDDDLSTVVDRFHYLYDKLGRLTKKVGVLDDDDPNDFDDDQMVEYVYDVGGNVVTYKAYYGASNGSSASTIYDYDLFSRLTTTTYPDSDTLTQTYDAAGNLITKIDPNASTIVYSYDGRNQRTQVDVTNGAAAAGVSKEAWAYDGLGRLTYAFNMIGANTICKINRAYTTHGKLDSERQQIYFDGTAGTDHTIAYLYDGDGDLETIEYPGHVASTNDDYVTYVRDYAGRITKVKKKDQGESERTVSEYVFEGMQRVITKKHYPDEATQALSFYEYDSLHRVTGITHQFDTSPVTKIAVYEYGYDHRNRRKYEDRYFYDRDDNRITSLSDKDRGEYYEYDLLGRLTKVYRALADSWTYPLSGGEYNTLVTYDYDKASNRTERVVATTTTTYAYDPGTNEMTAAAGFSRTYDDNGNYHAANTITCCHYDYKNQLAEIRYGVFPPKTRLYNYDPLGRRIQKYLPDGGGSTTRYLYAGNDLIAYADGGNSDSIEKKLVYGALGEPAEYETSGGTRYAFHENAQGSIGALSDRDNAHQDEQLRYNEYGETGWVQIDGGGASSVSGTQVDNEIGFLTGIWNSESGAGTRYSMGREYDPGWGRYRQTAKPTGCGDYPGLYSLPNAVHSDPDPAMGCTCLALSDFSKKHSDALDEFKDGYTRSPCHLELLNSMAISVSQGNPYSGGRNGTCANQRGTCPPPGSSEEIPCEWFLHILTPFHTDTCDMNWRVSAVTICEGVEVDSWHSSGQSSEGNPPTDLDRPHPINCGCYTEISVSGRNENGPNFSDDGIIQFSLWCLPCGRLVPKFL